MSLQKILSIGARIQRYISSPNLPLRDLRRLLHRRQIVHSTPSAYNGEVKVMDRGRERLLLLDNRCHSFGMTRGSDRELYREYWGHLHRLPFDLKKHPTVLMCGLGGGTGLKVLAKELTPASVTVLELDPVIVDVARRFFGIGDITGLEVLTGDEVAITQQIHREGRRFDLIVEDAMCLPTLKTPDLAYQQLARLLDLLSPQGCLVFNGPMVDKRNDPERISAFCAQAREIGLEVVTRDVGQRWWFNRMVYARRHPAATAS